MKMTQKNQMGLMLMKHHAKRNPNRVELTSSGKVHGGFGIIAEFTTREAAHETLTDLGYVAGATHGSFTTYEPS